MTTSSIIIPAYNQARYLSQAIESALCQSAAIVEIIVVDDGSTDETPEVVARYARHPSLRAIRQPNAGLPAARNRGAREATGDYLCFLDSDDWLAPDKIRSQAAILDADPDVALAYCDIVTVDEAGQPLPEQYTVAQAGRVLSGDIFPSLMIGGYFPPHTVLLRRDVFTEAGGFDPTLGGHADYDLWLRVAATHRAVFVEERLAYYRTHPTSMSKDGLHMSESRLATLCKVARQHPERAGAALHALQQLNQELHQANQWLNRNWSDVLGRAELRDAATPEGQEKYSLIRHFDSVRLVRGKPDQLQVWEATLDGCTTKAICLNAPAEMAVTLPVGQRGQLCTAVCIHPDAWARPGCGGCEFQVKVDGRLAFAVALDPAHIESDRHWHEIRLDVPENKAGHHQLTFETRPLGTGCAYRWAIWRNPQFVWTSKTDTHTPSTPVSHALTPA